MLIAPGRKRAPNVSLIRGLFDLTAAQARLAHALSETTILKDAARRLGITEGTARTQLKQIFGKTAVRSQAELLLLLNQYETAVELD